MNILQVVVYLLCLLGVLEIYALIKAWRQKIIKLALKEIGNQLSVLLLFIMIVYIALGASVITSSIQMWGVTHTQSGSNELGVWLLRNGIVYAWFIFCLLVVIWVSKMLSQPFKYNDKEKKIIKESQIQFKNKLPKVLKWLAGKTKS